MTLRNKLRFIRLDIVSRVEVLSKILTQSCVKIKQTMVESFLVLDLCYDFLGNNAVNISQSIWIDTSSTSSSFSPFTHSLTQLLFHFMVTTFSANETKLGQVVEPKRELLLKVLFMIAKGRGWFGWRNNEAWWFYCNWRGDM